MVEHRRSSRPLGALISQAVVAGSSLLLQLIAFRELGASGLGAFSLLFGVLVTVNAIQSGWIGDSLTVLDRFDPGLRRALLQSQITCVVIVAPLTTILASFVSGVDTTTAVLFGVASMMWVLEETLRRLLIARREFWQLVANDSSFAAGSIGLVVIVAVSGSAITLQTLVLALLSGATVAVFVGVMQLPRHELERGILGPSRMRELSSFAIWRAAQIGLRPATLSIVRAAVAATAGLVAVGVLEAARLLLAPALTVVSGAGVYLLPTYSNQAKLNQTFRPKVLRSMIVVAAGAGLYGCAAMLLRRQLIDLLSDGSTVVGIGSVAAWTLFSMGFGAGIPAGNAMVALGRSRGAFFIRLIDAIVGVVLASLCVAVGWFAAVPVGLAIGAFIGAGLLLRALHSPAPAPRVELAMPADRIERGEPRSVEWGRAVALPLRPPPRPVPVTRRRSATRRSGHLLWLLPLALIVATEFKVRRRSIDEVLEGRIDPLIAAELIVYAVVGVWALWKLTPRRLRLSALLVVMWCYILSTAISAIYSSFPTLAIARGMQLVIVGAVIHLLAIDGNLVTISRILHGWVVLMTASIVVGLAYVAPTSNTQRGRFTWLSVHSVSAGSMLALSVPVLFGLWVTAGRRRLPWRRWIYAALFLAHFTFLLLTRTRGSIAGGVIAIAVMAWVSSGRRLKPELALASLVGGGALALAFGGTVLRFLTRGESVEQIGTFNRRTEIWALAWDSFLEHPVFGLGFASAKGVFFDETGLGGAHNAAVNVMIDVGLVGLFWWFLLIAVVVASLTRLWQRERRSPILLDGATATMRSDLVIVLGIIVTSLVNGITTEGLGAGVNVSAIWFFVCVAWLTVLQRSATDATRTPIQTRSTESLQPDHPEAEPVVPTPAALGQS